MNDDAQRVGLIIPTLNEIEGMRWFMPRVQREWFDDLVVVDGGSTDGTIEYCREHGYPVVVQSGRGLPLGYVEVLGRFTSDILITITPDGNSLPELIPAIVAKIREGYDMVIASRYKGGARSEDDDFFTGIGNRMFTEAVNLLFGGRYTDTLVGLRGYRREELLRMRLHEQERECALRRWFFYMNSWELGASIRAAKLGLRVEEIPGDEPKRIGGVRKLSVWKNGLGAVLQILWEYWYGRNFLSSS